MENRYLAEGRAQRIGLVTWENDWKRAQDRKDQANGEKTTAWEQRRALGHYPGASGEAQFGFG